MWIQFYSTNVYTGRLLVRERFGIIWHLPSKPSVLGFRCFITSQRLVVRLFGPTCISAGLNECWGLCGGEVSLRGLNRCASEGRWFKARRLATTCEGVSCKIANEQKFTLSRLRNAAKAKLQSFILNSPPQLWTCNQLLPLDSMLLYAMPYMQRCPSQAPN